MRKIRCFLPCALFLLLISSSTVTAEEAVLGTAGCLMQAMSDPPATVAETTLGDLTADAVRRMAGTDIALVPAGEFRGNIQPGEVTAGDVHLALPGNALYAVAELTPADLAALMETAVGRVVLTKSYAIDRAASASEGFWQISGFTLRYDPNMLPGRRVKELRIAGTEYDRNDEETVFTAALPAGSLPDTANAGFTAAQAVEEYFRALGTVDEPESGRIYAIAVRDNDFIRTFPVVPIALCGSIFVLCTRILLKRRASDS